MTVWRITGEVSNDSGGGQLELFAFTQDDDRMMPWYTNFHRRPGRATDTYPSPRQESPSRFPPAPPRVCQGPP
jgi:hypothetical protein